MAEIFEIYNQQIIGIIGSISKDFTTLKSNSDDSEAEHGILVHIESKIFECEKLIKTLEIQQVTGASNANAYLSIKNYATGISEYKKRYHQEKNKYEEERNKKKLNLLSDEALETKGKFTTDNNSIAYNTFNNLQNANREAMGIEQKGTEIIVEMSTQTNQMKSIGGRVTTMNGQLTISSSLITEMDIQYRKNNKLLIALAIILLILFITIAAFRLISTKSTHAQDTTKIYTEIKANNTNDYMRNDH